MILGENVGETEGQRYSLSVCRYVLSNLRVSKANIKRPNKDASCKEGQAKCSPRRWLRPQFSDITSNPRYEGIGIKVTVKWSGHSRIRGFRKR